MLAGIVRRGVGLNTKVGKLEMVPHCNIQVPPAGGALHTSNAESS